MIIWSQSPRQQSCRFTGRGTSAEVLWRGPGNSQPERSGQDEAGQERQADPETGERHGWQITLIWVPWLVERQAAAAVQIR